MATTSYFEQDLSATDDSANADPSKVGCLLEIQVSSYSGKHQLYFRHVDANGVESYSVIPKAQAKELLAGLESAMGYLGYTT